MWMKALLASADLGDRVRRTLWIGIAGASLTALAAMFGLHDGSLWRLPAVLEARVEAALRVAGLPGLEVHMQGQRAMLLGIVEHDAAIPRARRAALRAEGPGGPWSGGITSVDVSGLRVGAYERPFTWRVRREAARIVLSGAVPSERARAELMRAAAGAFANAEAVDEMRVAGGAPSAAFTQVARRAVADLATLRSGEVRFVDNQIAFIGDGGQAAVDALARAYGEPPAPFRVRLEVTIDGLDLAHPELQGLNLASAGAETCAHAFARLLERNVINFAPGSAAIDRSSASLLDALASVALRCDRFSIEVSGHSDNQGARGANMALSVRRAETVAAYLASQGVSRARLAAQGYGPDRPRASNASASGQAANRRIEFHVSG